jgi:uncharacterized membrane protein
MSMGLQEVHPSIVHMPLAFAPLSIVSDIAGVMADDPSLIAVGRATIGLAAASAAVAAVTGLIAQEEVIAEGRAGDHLVTHRNLNLAGGLTLAGMALWRRNHDPGPGYIALGAGILGTMFYTAYLGGKMVYDHGVGVKAAGGTRGEVPEIRWGETAHAARAAMADVRDGAAHTAEDLRDGRLAPSLRRSRGGQAEPGSGAYEQWDDATAEPSFAAPFEEHPPIH